MNRASDVTSQSATGQCETAVFSAATTLSAELSRQCVV